MADGAKRAWLRHHAAVPDNHTDWATRVLTVLVSLVLIATYLLLDRFGEVNAFLVESTQQRQQFQEEQLLRTCVVLEELDVGQVRLRGLGC